MRTRRQQRKQLLKKSGFLAFEAEPLSVIPIKSVPYMKAMVRERRELLRDAHRQKVSMKQFEGEIKYSYDTKGFFKRDRQGVIIRDRTGKPYHDPWRFLRDVEDRFKARNPAYESPWEKGRRTFPDFMAKIEKTLAARERLRERTA